MEEQITLEEIVVLVRQLPIEDRLRLIEIITPEIEREARVTQPAPRSRRNVTPPNDYDDMPYRPVDDWRTFTYHDEN
jgi:hypothetical protein